MSIPKDVGSSSTGRLLIGVLSCLTLAVPLLVLGQATRPEKPRLDASPVELRREYQDRFGKLKADDVEGHYALAEWCREHRLYRSLLKQAQYVLQLEPDNENARLLYRVAVDALKAQNTQTRPAEGAAAAESIDGELLGPQQIQQLKYAEFLPPDETRPSLPIHGRVRRADRGESFKVRFAGSVLNDFLDYMSGHPDFRSRENRTAFLSLAPTRQAQLIREHSGNRFEDDIEIITNPLVFQQFERVLPMVMSGCATSSCHGGAGAESWRLRTARPRTDLNLYTNFLIVNRVREGGHRLVNRAKPEESLLLQYGLPPRQALFQHPEEIAVMFPRGREDARYRTILMWIENLRMPEPRTGVALPGYPEPPPPQLGGTPATQEPANAQTAPAPAP